MVSFVKLWGFQSTLPMRGATEIYRKLRPGEPISIHAPHAGSDRYPPTAGTIASIFQSTLPMRGATQHSVHLSLSFLISIHAPHAGSDVPYPLHDGLQGFQSTLPMRGATCRLPAFSSIPIFQSTLPMRGATG